MYVLGIIHIYECIDCTPGASENGISLKVSHIGEVLSKVTRPHVPTNFMFQNLALCKVWEDPFNYDLQAPVIRKASVVRSWAGS